MRAMSSGNSYHFRPHCTRRAASAITCARATSEGPPRSGAAAEPLSADLPPGRASLAGGLAAFLWASLKDPASFGGGEMSLCLLFCGLLIAVNRANQKIELQSREFSLLEYLMRNAGKVVSKALILEHVWDYSFDPQTNVVDVVVCRLRNKIDRDFDRKMIQTLRGVGYVLKAD